MNLLLLEDNETELPSADPRARHIRKVLKLGQGDRLRAGIINGPTGSATIEECQGGRFSLRFTPSDEPHPDSGRVVDLLLGHPRPIVLKRMLRDLCTIGVRRLIIVPTALGEKSYLKASMWNDIRRYLVEGAAQAGRTRLTDVLLARSLREGINVVNEDRAPRPGDPQRMANAPTVPNSASVPGPPRRYVLDPGAPSLAGILAAAEPAGPVVVAIGSERGWTTDELAVITGCGYTRAGLGTAILRTETAALVSTWIAGVAGLP